MIMIYLSDAKIISWASTFSIPSLTEGVESEDGFKSEEGAFKSEDLKT